MSRLRSVAHHVARAAPAAAPVTERLLATERVAAGLANRRMHAGNAARGGPRRMIATLWTAPFVPAAAILAAVRDDGGRACDRALILGWLRHYPADHPERADLAATLALAAGRHDWHWRWRGARWGLWHGPEGLAAALRAPGADDAALVAEAGVGDGRFLAAARTLARDRS